MKMYFTSQTSIEFILFPINHLWLQTSAFTLLFEKVTIHVKQ